MSEVKTSRTLLVSEVLRGEPCYTYRSKLDERFNVEINVTVKLALDQADDWDWYWAASRLLTEAGYETFIKAVREEKNYWSQSLAPLREIASEAQARAYAEYRRVLSVGVVKSGVVFDHDAYTAATDAYNEIADPFDAAMQVAREGTRSHMNKFAAKTFAELYIGEDSTTGRTGNDMYAEEADEPCWCENCIDEDEDY